MTTKNWTELNDGDKNLVVEVHCMGYQTNRKIAMHKAFDDGKPDIIFGPGPQGLQSVTVAAKHVLKMKILIQGIL